MRRMRVSTIALVTLAVAATTLAGCGRRGLIRINGEKISKDDFYARLEKVPVQTPQGTQMAGQYVIQQMINEKLIQQLAKDQGVAPTEEQVNKKVDRFKRESGGEFRKALAQQGISIDEFKQKLMVQQAMINVVSKGISVPDSKVRAAYDKALNAKNSPLKRPEQILVSGVITKDKAKIDKAVKMLASGVEFTSVAQQFTDPEVWTKQTDGKLGWVARDGAIDLAIGRKASFGKDFAAKVYAIGIGKTSPPTKSGGQWVVFRADQRRPAKITSYDDTKDVIREQLAVQEGAARAQVREAMQKFTQKADIVINAEIYKNIGEQIKKDAAKALDAAQKPAAGAVPTPSAAP